MKSFDLWIMPLFFLLSDAGFWYALKSRTGGRYLFERVKRLLNPLYTVGAFILLTLQLYWDRLTKGTFAGSLWEFYPHYFETLSLRFDPGFLCFCLAPVVLPNSTEKGKAKKGVKLVVLGFGISYLGFI